MFSCEAGRQLPQLPSALQSRRADKRHSTVYCVTSVLLDVVLCCCVNYEIVNTLSFFYFLNDS